MCTFAVLIDHLADVPLAIAANRDEMYDRPARAPVVLRPGVVGGRDEVLGGSWLAFTRDGRFAAVTNQREPLAGRAARSRGELVLGLLDAGDRAAMRGYAAGRDAAAYASANLVFGDASGADVAYLRRGPGTVELRALPRGITVVANDRIDAPGQPKQARLRAHLAPHRTWASFAAHAPAALADHALPPAPDPDTIIAGAPLPADLVHALHALCIHTPRYGTRSATVAALVPGDVAALHWADGPPCTTPFRDARPLLG